MSPYGQSVYYQALSESGSTVKGLTTVKTETVVVPQNWTDFFETDKITFNGLVDVNTYISNLIMYIGTAKTDCQTVSKNLWKQYLTGTGKDAITTADYQEEWHEALMNGWSLTCKTLGYSEECYMYPGKDVNYSE